MTNRVNTDPTLRFIILLEVDQVASTTGKTMAGFVPYSMMKNNFEDSKPIFDFFHDPLTIDQAMVVCLYTTPDKEVRRRIMRNLPMPQSDEEVYNYMAMTAESVGVQVNFHEMKVGAYEERIATSVVKEHPIFLYSLIDMYAGPLSGDPFGQLEVVKNRILQDVNLGKTEGTAGHIIGDFLQEYIFGKDNLYRLAAEFGGQLAKTDLKISSVYLPLVDKTKMLEFPFHFDFGSFSVRNAFVRVIPLTDTPAKSLTIVCPKIKNGTWNGDLFSATICIESAADIEASLEEVLQNFSGDVETYKSLVMFVLKCLVYIHSSECDIERERGAKSDKTNPVKRKKFYKIHSPFDIINVGFSFHGRVFTVGSTLVRGFFRWQPCGKAWSEVKLIWVNEHERKFKTVMEQELSDV